MFFALWYGQRYTLLPVFFAPFIVELLGRFVFHSVEPAGDLFLPRLSEYRLLVICTITKAFEWSWMRPVFRSF